MTAVDAQLESAAELVGRLLRFDAPADRVVGLYFREHGRLGQRERRLLTETVYRLLRELALLRHLAQGGPGSLERRLVLLAWAGDADALAPALSEAERQWLDAARAVDRDALPDALRHNLPEWLATALRVQVGDEDFWPLAASLNAPAPLDLRVNLLKARRADVQAELRDHGIESEPTRHSPWGLRLHGKPALGRLPLLARGDVEVQDEGSQLLAWLVEARRGETVVDFCAGGGGKTLALGAAMRNTGRVYALDTSGHRLDALKVRLARAGLDTVYPLQIADERDARLQRLAGRADRVLVDAPCSGTGTLRRNPELRWSVTPDSVAAHRSRQLAILEAAAALLKPGGTLLYATCSLLEQENESVACSFGATHAELRPVELERLLQRLDIGDAATPGGGHFVRLWPHRHATDGFFAARWVRAR